MDSVENFIQGELLSANLPAMRPQASKSTREIRIPPTEKSGGAEIRVVRSSRRKRSISAYREHGAIVIQVPARFPNSRVSEVIPELVERILTREAREKMSDNQLFERALHILNLHLPEFSVAPVSVEWRTMNERWGSCTTLDRTIRISDRLNGAPIYVIDYLLLHELIHLEIPDHGGDFESLLARFPQCGEASAYLEGYEAGARG
mgnify:FL=1